MNTVKIPAELFNCEIVKHSPLGKELGDLFADKLSALAWLPSGDRLFEFVWCSNDSTESVVCIGLNDKCDAICGIHVFTRIKGTYSIPTEVWKNTKLIDKLFTHTTPDMLNAFVEMFTTTKWSKLATPYLKYGHMYSITTVQSGGLTVITACVLNGKLCELSKTVK